jgi:hypothetical protein
MSASEEVNEAYEQSLKQYEEDQMNQAQRQSIFRMDASIAASAKKKDIKTEIVDKLAPKGNQNQIS